LLQYVNIPLHAVTIWPHVSAKVNWPSPNLITRKQKTGFFTYISVSKFSAETCSLILTEYDVGLTFNIHLYFTRHRGCATWNDYQNSSPQFIRNYATQQVQHSTDPSNSTVTFSSKYVARTSITADVAAKCLQDRKYNLERYQFWTSFNVRYGKGNTTTTKRTLIVSDAQKHICGCLNKCFMSP
jgi:hypothetical protein